MSNPTPSTPNTNFYGSATDKLLEARWVNSFMATALDSLFANGESLDIEERNGLAALMEGQKNRLEMAYASLEMVGYKIKSLESELREMREGRE